MSAKKQEPQTAEIDAFYTDFNIKIRDLEEKQNMIKDRVLLIGENLVSLKQESDEELLELKSQITELEQELKKIRLALARIIESQSNLARKTELEILKRQFQMFQPLEFARISDVENIVKKILEKQKK